MQFIAQPFADLRLGGFLLDLALNEAQLAAWATQN